MRISLFSIRIYWSVQEKSCTPSEIRRFLLPILKGEMFVLHSNKDFGDEVYTIFVSEVINYGVFGIIRAG